MAERLWTTRVGAEADAAQILALRRTVFGEVDREKLRPEVWRWQFVDNPAGRGYIRLADHDGTVVGQYAAIPTRFHLAGDGREDTATFALSCDTMTHPSYQKQGMFVTLARELYADMAQQHGVTTTWGFPNDASHPGFVGKLDWFDITVFPTRVKPIRSAAVLRRWVRSRAASSVLGAVADAAWRVVAPRAREPRRCRFEPLGTFDARFDDLWRRHRDVARVVQTRDAAWCNWRFCAVPEFAYRPFAIHVDGALVGWVVLRVVELFDLPFGALVDVFPWPIVDDEVCREILSFAELHARREGAAFLTALLPPRWAHHLTRFGFLSVPERVNPRRWYLGARCVPEDRPLLQDIGNWYVTYGDADIV